MSYKKGNFKNLKMEEKVMKENEKKYNPCAKDEELGRTRKMTCEICGRTYYDYKGGRGGRNPDPLKYKSCCPVCDEFIVMPTRIRMSEIIKEVQEGQGQEREDILAEENREREERARR